MNFKRRNSSRDFSAEAIGRRAVLKGSMLGGSAVLAEGLFAGLLPNPAPADAHDLGQETNATSAAGNTTGKPLGEIEQIKLEYVFQIRIEFSERVSFKTPNGRRAYVPAVSGVTEGPRLQGRVVPRSGADYAGNGSSMRTTCCRLRMAR